MRATIFYVFVFFYLNGICRNLTDAIFDQCSVVFMPNFHHSGFSMEQKPTHMIQFPKLPFEFEYCNKSLICS